MDGNDHSFGRLGEAKPATEGGMPVAHLPSVRLLFDRGTILVRDLDPGFDPSDIPRILWDPRVQAYRTPAYRHRALRDELIRRAVPFTDEIRAKAGSC
jgi:hypothetical protein